MNRYEEELDKLRDEVWEVSGYYVWTLALCRTVSVGYVARGVLTYVSMNSASSNVVDDEIQAQIGLTLKKLP